MVSASSATLIANLLSACSAMANYNDEDADDGDQTEEHAVSWCSGSATLSVLPLHAIANEMTFASGGKDKVDGNQTSKTMLASLNWGSDVSKHSVRPA